VKPDVGSESRFLPPAVDAHDRREGGGGSRRNIVMPFGTEKTRMEWLPHNEKKLKICLFVFTECTKVTDTQTHTHRQTYTA